MTLTISNTIQWVIVPGIMVALLGFALLIARSKVESDLRVSAWAGLWAGLILFVVYVVSQLNLIREPDLSFSALPSFQFVPMAFGLVIGFAFLWIMRIMIPTRLVGLITLFLAGTSTVALFTYIFISFLRIEVLYATLGTALGILLHIVFFPTSVRDIF